MNTKFNPYANQEDEVAPPTNMDDGSYGASPYANNGAGYNGAQPGAQQGGGFNWQDAQSGASIGGGLGAAFGGLASVLDPYVKGLNEQEKQQLLASAGVRMQAADAGPSAYANLPPGARAAQMQALAQMQRVASGGWQPQDQAAVSNALTQTATADRGSREAIMAHMRAQGMGGSGNELAAQLGAQQSQYDRANQAGTNAAADSRARALQAMSASGAMAGGIRSGDATQAGGMDAMARYNALNKQQANEWNANQEVSGDKTMAGYYGNQADIQRGRWIGTGQFLGGAIGAGIGGLSKAYGGG